MDIAKGSKEQLEGWTVRVMEEHLSVTALADLLGSLADRLAAEYDLGAVESLNGAAKLLKGVSSNLRTICDGMADG